MHCTLRYTWVLLLACAACGNPSISGSTGSEDANGVIYDGNTVFSIPSTGSNGNSTTPTYTTPTVQPFTAADVAFVQNGVAAGIAGSTGAIVLNSTAGVCADANTNTFHLGEVQVFMKLTDIPDPSLAANTYVFPAGTTDKYQISSVTYGVIDAPCYDNSIALQSGTVTLTTSSATAVSGSYSLTFSTGSISGTFNSTQLCAALASPPVANPTCK